MEKGKKSRDKDIHTTDISTKMHKYTQIWITYKDRHENSQNHRQRYSQRNGNRETKTHKDIIHTYKHTYTDRDIHTQNTHRHGQLDLKRRNTH